MSTTTASKVRKDLDTLHRRYATEFNAFFGGMDDEQREEYEVNERPFSEDLVDRLEAEGYDMASIGRVLLAEFLEGQFRQPGVVYVGHAVGDF